MGCIWSTNPDHAAMLLSLAPPFVLNVNILIMRIDKQSDGRKIKCNETQCNRSALGNGMNYCSHQYKTDALPPDSKCTIQNCYYLKTGRAAICMAHKCQDPTCDLVQITSVISMDA
ncbi:hypothetical protein BTUL_0080g00350 [Botrytis tulipae]|uniref:Uncharacterized protein n=1 Tax=Botrytis tulipae TaxID=87230 RepID=A0A4Z1EKJ5_9HELO|nr:hypothetical protein BTUL_0080g00350 [Botrytis tulipae]